jgi:MFS family permease
VNRDLVWIGISLFTWGLGEGMFLYFQPIYLQEWGADPVMIGSILGAVGISMGIAQIPAGYLSDRFGPRPLLWVAWITGAVATMLMAIAQSLPVFITGMLLYGITAFVMTPLNTYISFISGNWSLGRVLTLISFAYNSGAAIGPLAGGWVAEKFGLIVIYRIAAVIFLISVLFIFLIRPHRTSLVNVETNTPVSLHRNPAFLALLVLIFFTMFAGLFPQSLTPNFLRNERGVSFSQIGSIGSVGSLGNALISLLFGGLAPRAGLLVGSFFIMLYSSLIWQGTSFAWYSVGYFFIGGYRLNRAMATAYTRPMVIAAQTGLAFGLIETANAAAVVLAPFFAGMIYNWRPSAIYPASIGISLIVILLIVFFKSHTVKKTG